MIDPNREHFVTISDVDPDSLVQNIEVRGHKILADEPKSFPGGNDKGLSPTDFLLSSLGSCTSMTLRLYARLKKLPLKKIIVKLDRKASGEIIREIELIGDLTEEQRQRLFEISNKCPIHKSLSNQIIINSELV
jgi:putative redox protein